MIIDWYTIIFQIINFLILVFLLRLFLYFPIIRAMDDREEKIMQREEEANALKREAEEAEKSYRHKSADLERQEDEIRDEARAEAEKEKHAMLDRARREVEDIRDRWEEDFTREKQTFIDELRRRIGRQACAVARRCLQDLADARLEALTWSLFSARIKNLSEEERRLLQEALTEEQHRLYITSAFEPPRDELKALKKTLQELFPDLDLKGSLSVETRTDPELVCGLELSTGGYRVAWSIDNYLEDVEEQILTEIDQIRAASNGKEEEVSGRDQAEKDQVAGD